MPNRKREDRLTGQVALITGSAGGIGKNIATVLGGRGARVILCDIDKIKGLKAQAELRKKGLLADFVWADLSRVSGSQEMIREVAKRFGRLDILVNNARSGVRSGLLDESEDSWERCMAVTLKAAFFCSQEVIRVMSKRKVGNIVNISSIAAFASCHESPAYHIAKAGLVQLTRYLAAHAGRYGVRVNAVLPGFIVQDEHLARFKRANNRRYRQDAEFCHPVGRLGRSNNVADAVAFLCSKAASFISGESLILDGALTTQDPYTLASQFAKKK